MSAVGLAVNVGLAVIKLLAGLLGHSMALVADAVESFTDIIGSLVVWGGLQIAARPADAEHPYGHGRAEALAGMIVGLMLVGAAIGIALQSVRGILAPHPAPAAFTLAVLIGVIAVKETMFQMVRRTARQTGSSAVLADAWHHRSDALTSAAAAVGITVALVGGPAYAPADDWAALFAAGVIVMNAYRLLRVPVHDLMDREPPHLIARVRAVALAVPGVADVEKILARKSGLRYWVDMHLEVDPEITVRHAHELAHGVKDAIRLGLPEVEEVLIHVEPHEPQHRARRGSRTPEIRRHGEERVEN
jgi:cation diffusion facilitator family transporter